MGLSFSGYKYLPVPDDISREKMNIMGIVFKNEDHDETEYSLPFGWDITQCINKNEFLIFDYEPKLRVVISDGKYEIIEQENDTETELTSFR